VVRRILVPVDGSPVAEHALPFALSIARAAGAEVHVALVHVPEAYTDYEYPGAEDLELDAKAREQHYLSALSGRLRAAFTGTLQLHHLEGIPEETLVEEVAERQIDLVVMNAHGWGYISRAITGSVSDYLVRNLAVPILLMHSRPVSTDLDRPIAFRRILVCLDGSELSEAIMEPARAIGQLFGATYHLTRVAAPPSHMAPTHDAESSAALVHVLDHAKRAAASYLALAAGSLRYESIPVETQVLLSNNVAAAVLQEAETANCDLIATSTHGRGGLSRLLLGSVADKIIRGATKPVLVYRAETE
jgi:nucleotide-binding universal stress UspA family protein